VVLGGGGVGGGGEEVCEVGKRSLQFTLGEMEMETVVETL